MMPSFMNSLGQASVHLTVAIVNSSTPSAVSPESPDASACVPSAPFMAAPSEPPQPASVPATIVAAIITLMSPVAAFFLILLILLHSVYINVLH